MESTIKKFITIISVIFLILFLSSCTGKNTEIKDGISTNTSSNNEVITTKEEGILTDYSDKTLKEAKGDIVLFFYAEWCGACMASKDDIMKKGVPKDLTILIANFDTETELKKKYGVRTQTTFVQVDNQGNMIKKWQGGKLDKIIENVEIQKKK